MIQKTTAFKVGEEFFPTIAEAQAHELTALIGEDTGLPPDSVRAIASAIVEAKAQVLNILTMTTTSRPRARKANKPIGQGSKPAATLFPKASV